MQLRFGRGRALRLEGVSAAAALTAALALSVATSPAGARGDVIVPRTVTPKVVTPQAVNPAPAPAPSRSRPAPPVAAPAQPSTPAPRPTAAPAPPAPSDPSGASQPPAGGDRPNRLPPGARNPLSRPDLPSVTDERCGQGCRDAWRDAFPTPFDPPEREQKLGDRGCSYECRPAGPSIDAQPGLANPLSGTIFDAGPGEDPLAGTIFDVSGGGAASSRAPQPKAPAEQPAPLDDIGSWDLENPYGIELEGEGGAGGLDPDDWRLHLLEN